MTTVSKCLRLAAAAVVLSAAGGAADDKPPKRDLAGEKKDADFRGNPEKDKLQNTAAAAAPKLVYLSAARKSSFDLAAGGVEHLLFGTAPNQFVFVYPLEYKGESPDGMHYVYREAGPDDWYWYFAKNATNGKYLIRFYHAGSFYIFDSEGERYPRAP